MAANTKARYESAEEVGVSRDHVRSTCRQGGGLMGMAMPPADDTSHQTATVWLFHCFALTRAEAIERIVGAYVELRNRRALEDMKAHRHRFVTELKSMNGTFDLSSPIKQLETDIAVIDAGLVKLNTTAAA